jgi:hypothetical protein
MNAATDTITNTMDHALHEACRISAIVRKDEEEGKSVNCLRG